VESWEREKWKAKVGKVESWERKKIKVKGRKLKLK
jgi:hypothetical protein